ncbi:hypothetical protein APC1476_1658 [Bifidobacterium longum]|nr:hypothetical protein APC1476_1658 [Bifidobacterium longum]
MLIPSMCCAFRSGRASLSRRVNANSQRTQNYHTSDGKLIKKGEC